MKILVIRFSAMGDVVLCHPVLSELTRLNPELKIDFLTRKGLEFIVEGIPNVNSIAVKFKKGVSGFLQLLQLVKELRNKHYDCLLYTSCSSLWLCQYLTYFLRLYSYVRTGWNDQVYHPCHIECKLYCRPIG